MKKHIPLSILILCAMSAFSQYNWQVYPYTPLNSVLSFPTDDGEHTSLSTETEWWYMNMHMFGSAPNYKQYDVMLCYFIKPATMRIFNMASPGSGVFYSSVNQLPLSFTATTGHWGLDYTTVTSSFGIIDDSSSWRYHSTNKTFDYKFYAVDPDNNDQINVTVTSNRAPLVVGGNGFIPIGTAGDSSFYYSITNLKVAGTLSFGGTNDTITSGIAWIDRQYGPFTVGTNTNNLYEWFSMQMDKPGITWGNPQTPSEYNIWQIFSDTNSIPYNLESRLVSSILPNGTQDTVTHFIFERTGYWHDVADNKYYSQGWRLINPLKGENLDMSATIQNQIINVTLFKFWEGGTTIKGTVQNQPMDGLGFAELVEGHNSNIITPSIPLGLSITPDSNIYLLKWNPITAGTYPIGGYRVFKSPTNDGHWIYLTTVTDTTYTDFTASADTGYFYTITSFDNQTATSASVYATAVWADPLTTSISTYTSSSLQVYPNPAHDRLFVKDQVSKNNIIEITDAVGNVLLSQKLNNDESIDISNLASGIYIIKVITDKEVFNKKIIKE